MRLEQDMLNLKYKHRAALHDRLAFCHTVLAEDEKALEVANILLLGRWAGDGMVPIDAALMAIREGHGDMQRIAQECEHDSRRAMGQMIRATALRTAGLLLVDAGTEWDDSGDGMHCRYLVALRDKPTIRPGLHRMVLRMALEVGLVGPATRCTHSHDCCGCWQLRSPIVKWVEANLFEISQSSYANV